MKRNDRERDARLHGLEAFDAFYHERLGARWDALKEAMQKDGNPIMWQHGGRSPYYLDAASIMAASSMPRGGKRILDMCAAPGGKSLVLSSLMAEDATLVCNERSSARYKRLCTVLNDCLPPAIRERIKTACTDGAVMCRHCACDAYDRILLDAPCSSERHVMLDSKYMAQWSPSRIKSLAIAQWALVSSAWRMLKAGGYLLYCTCALCREENDGIIERLLHKMQDALPIDSRAPPADILDGGDSPLAGGVSLSSGTPLDDGNAFLCDGSIDGGSVPLASGDVSHTGDVSHDGCGCFESNAPFAGVKPPDGTVRPLAGGSLLAGSASLLASSASLLAGGAPYSEDAEHDIVLIKRFAPDYRVPHTELTQYGTAILPDTSCTAGPMYFAIIKKAAGG